MLSVLEGLLVSADERLVSLVALLDLSAVLGWFASYLSERFSVSHC